MPNCAENTPPSKNIPTQPNGELLNSCARLIGFVRSKAGVGLTDNKIGAKEIDTSIEIIINKLYPFGFPIANTPCAETIPIICTIIYRDKACPRLSLLTELFNQLSAVM